MVFEKQQIIDEPQYFDIWVIYHPNKNLERSYSLSTLLWDIIYDASNFVNNYKVKHSNLYNILSGEFGKANLAFLFHNICFLL